MRSVTASLKGVDSMRAEWINRVSSLGLVVLSLSALSPVLIGALLALFGGQDPFHESDEGTGAHIFQLSIVALFPMTLLFFVTADWAQPVRSARRLAFPGAAVVIAFALLYYFEQYT